MSVRAWEWIDTQVLGGDAASVSFTPLSDEYRRWIVSVYIVNDANAKGVNLRFNGDSGTNYAYQDLSATSTTVAVSRITGFSAIQSGAGSIAASSVGQIVYVISKPAAGVVARVTAGLSKDIVTDGIALNAIGGEWTNVAALITRIDVLAVSNNFAAGTRVVLFGARR